MELKTINVEAGELAWHDWCRTLKIRKPTGIHVNSGAMAFDKSLDAWHPDAFAGTGVEHLVGATTEPRRVVFDAIDWCGNVIGQIEDCPYGPTGTLYHVQGLGVDPAGYELADYGMEMMPDGNWAWWLFFTYHKQAAKWIHQQQYPTHAQPHP